ncbi:MAG TPA: CGNR zinc finger domain-containing protein [Gemmatimonadaceae bacterium]|nr:CGNR zinc finger domain-containing protein [Gemmatimonadaceae bacterium]
MSSKPGPQPARLPSTAALERPAALFVGNALWLDFINTRYIVRNRPVDVLRDFEALVSWLVESGSLAGHDAQTAMARWNGKAEGAAVLARALALRDSFRDLAELLASGAGRAVREEEREGGETSGTGGALIPASMATAVAAINGIFRENVSYDELTPVPDHAGTIARFARHARLMDSTPFRLLASLADSASELLCGGGDPSRVHRCGNPKCVLYFYDTTRNRRRLFCSPEGCGNRVKAAARYRRSKESGRAKLSD